MNQLSPSFKKLMFLCTGNYYRSRFAEEYFNHKAEAYNLKWQSFSRGLSENFPNPNNIGPISNHAVEALKKHEIFIKGGNRHPQRVIDQDFLESDKTIAMSEIEHYPMMQRQFIDHLHKVEYFEIGDLPVEEPPAAMQRLANYLDELIIDLTTEGKHNEEMHVR